MGLGDCGSEDEDHMLASSPTCDMIAADSQPQPDVALIREEQASSNPAQGCEGSCYPPTCFCYRAETP